MSEGSIQNRVGQSRGRLGTGPVSALLCGITLGVFGASAAPDQPSTGDLWAGEVGSGFRKGTSEFGVGLGAGFGVAAMGSRSHHHWALGTAQYGWMLTDPIGEGWLRGNPELLVEVFGGMQFHPSDAYVIGGAPLIRYNFMPGGRWVPFVDLGAGLTATDIRDGDLSTTFEFNLQFGAGAHYFLRRDLALTLQYRFFHLSNANLDAPNLGVNNNTVLLGVGWFF